MTFRIPDDIMKKLKTEAETKEISLNTMVNQILRRYVEWGMFEPKIGMIPIPKLLVIELFENIEKDKLFDIASRVGKNTVSDISLFMKNKIDVPSFLSWFETKMKNSSIEFNHTYENGIHTYVMRHDLGENWSLYHTKILELVFNDLLGKSIDISSTKSSLIFKCRE